MTVWLQLDNLPYGMCKQWVLLKCHFIKLFLIFIILPIMNNIWHFIVYFLSSVSLELNVTNNATRQWYWMSCANKIWAPFQYPIRRFIVRPKSRSRKIGSLNYPIALKFDRCIGSCTAEVPVKFRSYQTILNIKLTASILNEILR